MQLTFSICLFSYICFVLLAVVVSVWDGTVFKKGRMTLLEISSAIVQKVVSSNFPLDLFL